MMRILMLNIIMNMSIMVMRMSIRIGTMGNDDH